MQHKVVELKAEYLHVDRSLMRQNSVAAERLTIV
jgi:hypothetical protein